VFAKKSCGHLSPAKREAILKLSALDICGEYAEAGTCKDSKCLCVHVCKGWVSGSCSSAKCRRNHSFSDDDSQMVLELHQMLNWKTDALKDQLSICKWMMLNSTASPQSSDSVPKVVSGIKGSQNSTAETAKQAVGIAAAEPNYLHEIMVFLIKCGKQGTTKKKLDKELGIPEKDSTEYLQELWKRQNAIRSPDGSVRVWMSSF
jgi:hypothetical protein